MFASLYFLLFFFLENWIMQWSTNLRPGSVFLYMYSKNLLYSKILLYSKNSLYSKNFYTLGI